MAVLQGLILPKILYSTESEYNGKIDVVQVGNTRKIRVGNIDQSISWNSPNTQRLYWGRAIDVLKQNEPNLKNILILGLGGATIQHLVSREFPEAHMVSIDIDEQILDVAKKYFELEEIQNHRVIIDDACRVIVEPENYGLMKQSFQAALVDIYIGNKYPDLGKSGNFVAAIKDMVVPGGLVIFDRIYTEEHQDDVNAFVDFVEGFLHDVQTVVVAGYTNSDNILIYGRA